MEMTYRNLIVEEFNRRRTLNPAYSMRALARDLGITAPQLSSVLAGKKGISLATAKRLSTKLDLSGEEADFFYQSVVSLHARDKKARTIAKQCLKLLATHKTFNPITSPQFSVLNEWYYLSILQTFELKDFIPSAKWVAQKLGVSPPEIEIALKELTDAGLLSRKNAFYVPAKEYVKTEEIPSKIIRNHLQKMMRLASEALESQSIHERDFSSAVFPIDPRELEEFKKTIRNFREQFCKQASKGCLTEVYNLSIQFFRLTKQNNKEQL